MDNTCQYGDLCTDRDKLWHTTLIYVDHCLKLIVDMLSGHKFYESEMEEKLNRQNTLC